MTDTPTPPPSPTAAYNYRTAMALLRRISVDYHHLEPALRAEHPELHEVYLRTSSELVEGLKVLARAIREAAKHFRTQTPEIH